MSETPKDINTWTVKKVWTRADAEVRAQGEQVIIAVQESHGRSDPFELAFTPARARALADDIVQWAEYIEAQESVRATETKGGANHEK